MLSPSQIKSQSFPQVGRGAYRAQEVDAFMERLIENYTELYSENSNMKKKFSSLTSVVEEYNEGKNAIATALVKAQAVADQTLESANAKAEAVLADATAQAQALLDEKKQEAETYAKEKKETADAYFRKAESELQRILTEAEAQSRNYVAEVNAKAAAIIADANEKAANLVAAAYKDAQAAREKADEIIARAQVEMTTTQNAIAMFKQSAIASLGQLMPMVQAIKIDESAAAEIENTVSAELPKVEAQTADAPTFDLEGLFSTFDMNVENDRVALSEELSPVIELPEEEAEEAREAEEAPAEVIDFEEIGADEPEETPEAPETVADPEPREVEEMPVYHPFVAPKPDLFATSLFDSAPAEENVDDVSLDDIHEAVPEQPAFSEQDVTDEPQPLKFKLTKNFDIFDEEDS